MDILEVISVLEVMHVLGAAGDEIKSESGGIEHEDLTNCTLLRCERWIS